MSAEEGACHGVPQGLLGGSCLLCRLVFVRRGMKLLLLPVFGCGRWIAEGKAKVQTITSIGGQKFKVRAA